MTFELGAEETSNAERARASTSVEGGTNSMAFGGSIQDNMKLIFSTRHGDSSGLGEVLLSFLEGKDRFIRPL